MDQNIELAMVMIILSRILNYSISRWANIGIGLVLTFVQIGSLIGGDTTQHYWFFSAVEILTTVFIAWTAWQWKEQDA